MKPDNESTNRARALKIFPVDLGLFVNREKDIEDLAALIVSDVPDTREYAYAAALDLMTSCIAFTSECGSPHERNFATVYKLCSKASGDQLALMFKQFAEGLDYNKKAHVFTKTLEPHPDSFAVSRYNSLVANCSTALMEKAHDICIAKLRELTESGRDTFIRRFDERFPSHLNDPIVNQDVSRCLEEGFIGLHTQCTRKAPFNWFQLISIKVIEETAPGRGRAMSSWKFHKEAKYATQTMYRVVARALEDGDRVTFGKFSIFVRHYKGWDLDIERQKTTERTWKSPEDLRLIAAALVTEGIDRATLLSLPSSSSPDPVFYWPGDGARMLRLPEKV